MQGFDLRVSKNKYKTAPRSAFRIPRSGDLDNIVLKALKKESSRRYSTVEQFSEDIRRHLENLPVIARPDTFSYRAAKFVNRNRASVFAGLLIFLTLIGGVIATIWQARRAEANQARAEKRFDDVRRLSNALLFELSPKIERLQGSTEAREVLVNRALEYLDSLAQEAGEDMALQSELAAAYEKIGDLQGNPENPNLIDSNEAIKSYEKAREIRSNLLEKNQNDFQQQRNLAENYRVSGKIYGQANDYQIESENLEHALRIYEKLLAEKSESNELKFASTQINYDTGKNRANSQKYGDSFPYLEKAIAALENLRRANPNQIDVLKLLGDCHTQYAIALSWEERQKEAEAESAKAIIFFESAAAQNPNDTNLRAGLWTAYLFSSGVYEEINDALSHEYALKALKIIEERMDCRYSRKNRRKGKRRKKFGGASKGKNSSSGNFRYSFAAGSGKCTHRI